MVVATFSGQGVFAHRWYPTMMVVRQGDTVDLAVANPDEFAHQLELPGYNIKTKILNPGESEKVTFVADKVGVFEYHCSLPYDPANKHCTPDHDQTMRSPASARPSYTALAAVVLAVAALLLNILSLPSGGGAPAEPSPPEAGPSTIDVSLIITGLGAAGAPAEHHYYNPSMIVARRGDRVRVRYMNLTFASHGLEIEGYGVRTGILPGGPKGQETVEFVADRAGIFRFKCYLPYDPAAGHCSPDHDTQIGYLVVLDPPH
jgi:plastocyanin